MVPSTANLLTVEISGRLQCRFVIGPYKNSAGAAERCRVGLKTVPTSYSVRRPEGSVRKSYSPLIFFC